MFALNLKSQDLKYYMLAKDIINNGKSNNKEAYKDAIPYLERSIFYNKYHMESYSLLIRSQMEAGDYESAITTIQKANKALQTINENWLPNYLSDAGYIERRNGNIDKSNEYYNKALAIFESRIERDQYDIAAVESKAFILCLMDKKEQSIDFITSIKQDPYHSDFYSMIKPSIEKLNLEEFYNKSQSNVLNQIKQDFYLAYSNYEFTERTRYAHYNFLEHNYKYLDDNYNVSIRSKQFQKILNEYNLDASDDFSYTDSLRIILLKEFKTLTESKLAYEVLCQNNKVLPDSSTSRYKYIEVFFEDVQKGKYFSDYDKQMQANIFYGAFYRFKKHVVLKDGLFEVNLTSNEEINISPTLYNLFINYYKETNKVLEKALKDPEFNKNYLKDNPDGSIPNQPLYEIPNRSWESVWKFYQRFSTI